MVNGKWPVGEICSVCSNFRLPNDLNGTQIAQINTDFYLCNLCLSVY